MSYLPQKYSTSFMDVILGTLGAFFLLLIIISTNRRGVQEKGSDLPRNLMSFTITDEDLKIIHFSKNIGYFIGLIDNNGKLSDVYYSDYSVKPENNNTNTSKLTITNSLKPSYWVCLQLNVSDNDCDNVVIGFWLRELPEDFSPSLKKKLFEDGIPIQGTWGQQVQGSGNSGVFNLVLKKQSDKCKIPFFCVYRPGKSEITDISLADFLYKKQDNYTYHKPEIDKADFRLSHISFGANPFFHTLYSDKFYKRVSPVAELCIMYDIKSGSQNVGTMSFSEDIHKFIKLSNSSNPNDDNESNNSRFDNSQSRVPDPIGTLNDLLDQLYTTDTKNQIDNFKNNSFDLDCAYMGKRSLSFVITDGRKSNNSILYHIMDGDSAYPYHSWKKIYPSPEDGETAKWETITSAEVNSLKEKYPDLGDDFIYAFAEYLAEPLPAQGTEEKPLPFRRNPMIDLWVNTPIPETEAAPPSEAAPALPAN